MSRLDETETLTMDPFFDMPYVKTRKRNSKVDIEEPLFVEDDFDIGYFPDKSNSDSDSSEDLGIGLGKLPKLPPKKESTLSNSMESFKLKESTDSDDIEITPTIIEKSSVHKSDIPLTKTPTIDLGLSDIEKSKSGIVKGKKKKPKKKTYDLDHVFTKK